MAPTKWGILSAGLISNDFVNAIHALNDNSSHEVIIKKGYYLKNSVFFKMISFLGHCCGCKKP